MQITQTAVGLVARGGRIYILFSFFSFSHQIGSPLLTFLKFMFQVSLSPSTFPVGFYGSDRDFEFTGWSNSGERIRGER
jgi:hypothetical protein